MRLIPVIPHNGIQHGVSCGKCRDLRQIADIKIPAAHHRAVIRLFQACCNLKKRGFTGAVDTDKTHLLTLIDAERRIIKQQALRIRFCQMFDCN